MAWQEIKTVNVTLNGAGPWVVAISALDYGVIAGFWAHVLLDGEIYTSTGISGTKLVVNNHATTGWKEIGFDDSLWAHNFTSTPKCGESIWENGYGGGFYSALNRYAGTGTKLNAATWYPDCTLNQLVEQEWTPGEIAEVIDSPKTGALTTARSRSTGTCCSQYGYCGKGRAYCEDGCQSSYNYPGVECKSERPNSPKPGEKSGSCGGKQGRCKEAGSCCSQYGYCGMTAAYCGTGCQASFNYPGVLCIDPANSTPLPAFTPTPEEGSCGLNIGNCLTSGTCCSQYGYCGKGRAYCEDGCQSSYNYPGVECKSERPNSPKPGEKSGSCGGKQGRCKEAGSCCSQYGYCGMTAAYCGTGCQASFNYPGVLCIDPANSTPLPAFTPTPEEGSCGLNIGNCLTSGTCCSQYGYCGKGRAYCEDGCQSSYNYPGVECKSERPNSPKPGEKSGSCGGKQGKCKEAGSCCSQYGYCGMTAAYCGTGCQASFNYPGVLCIDPANSTPLPAFTPTPEEGSCGLNIGNCLTSGTCCSQYGYCGKGRAYWEDGCQSSYNYPGVECKSERPNSPKPGEKSGSCGGKQGRCKEAGSCCSQYGYCGMTAAYCGTGCQASFNYPGVLCIDPANSTPLPAFTPTPEEGSCGLNIGNCLTSGTCCSQYGYCGKGRAYCEDGCQSSYNYPGVECKSGNPRRN